MPMPLSQTSMRNRSPRRRQPTTTPPRSVYRTAMDTRLSRMRWSRMKSLSTQALLRAGERRLDVPQKIGDRELRQVGSERARVELGDVEQRIEQVVHGADRGVD